MAAAFSLRLNCLRQVAVPEPITSCLCSGPCLVQQEEPVARLRGIPKWRIAMLKSLRLGIVAAVALVLWTGTPAADEKGSAPNDGHVMVRPDDIKWGPAPPALPAGAKIAVLAGDPSKAGPYVMRAQLPDGYKVPPHWHPVDENVTVL